VILDPDTLLLHLRIAGALLALLVVVNLLLPYHLRWRDDMATLSLINRQVVRVHAIFITLMVALCSALLLTSSEALLEPGPLSRAILIGLTVFWGLRMLMQWCYYSVDTWRGSRLRTAVHYAFSVVWVYMTTTFAAGLWSNVSRTL
jgi:hypothetical protein